MHSKREVVWSGTLSRVELLDLEVATADKVVVADDDTGNGGKEDGVRGEVGGEAVVGLEELPRAHYKADKSAYVASATDIEVSGHEGGHIRAGRDGVGGDVCTELGEGESRCDDEDAETSAGGDIGFV